MIEVVETCPNAKGLCAISASKDVCVLACPEKKVGTVRVIHFDKNCKTLMINGHQSQLSALALNNDGTLLATASDKVSPFVGILILAGHIGQNLRHGVWQTDSGTAQRQ